MKLCVTLNLMVIIFLACMAVDGADHYIGGFDQGEQGNSLLFYKIEASSYLKDGTGIDYGPNKAHDGKSGTAWCVKGPGIGEWIKYYIAESQLHYNGIMNVYRLLLVNGLVANKELYQANNRIKKMRVDFSDGQSKTIELKDGSLDFQVFIINIKARWVKFTILDIYKGSKYNDTCSSQIEMETWTHPSEMTPEQRKRRGYK